MLKKILYKKVKNNIEKQRKDKINKKKSKKKVIISITLLLTTLIMLLTTLNTFIKLVFSEEVNSLNSSEVFSSPEIIIQYQKTNLIDIKREEKSLIDYITLFSYYYPQNLSFQKTVNFYSNYEKEIRNSQESDTTPYIFNITHPKSNNINVTQTFLLDNTKYYPKITTTATYFPIQNNYTKFSKLININYDIRKKANELASTSNDTFQIAVNIANWINKNVKYSLDSIADNPKETSTGVFYHRVGVCKEITNLFVSMVRSLGIPARVVIGQAYTNDPIFKKNWVGHAWAEVYINNKWVPFDLTYNEYGYIDPSHITFQRFPNYSYEKSDSVITRGYGIRIGNFSMNQQIKILKVYNEIPTNERVDLIADKKELKFGSSDYLILKITNLGNFYKYKKYYIVGPKEVILYKKNISVVLKPYQTKTIFINFKIKENLNNNYIYTLPIAIYNSNYDEIKEVDIKSAQSYPYLNKEINIKNISTINKITRYLKVSCSLKEYNKTNNYQLYRCTFTNENPNMLQNIELCFNKKCFYENFLILENKTYFFNTNKTNNTIRFSNKEYILFLNDTEANKFNNIKNISYNNLSKNQNYKMHNLSNNLNSTYKKNYSNNINKSEYSYNKIKFNNSNSNYNNNLNKKEYNSYSQNLQNEKMKEKNSLLDEILNIFKTIKNIFLFIFT